MVYPIIVILILLHGTYHRIITLPFNQLIRSFLLLSSNLLLDDMHNIECRPCQECIVMKHLLLPSHLYLCVSYIAKSGIGSLILKIGNILWQGTVIQFYVTQDDPE